jgi:hypothetical protein
MKNKRPATVVINERSRARAALARVEKALGRIRAPRPWIREFVRRNGRLPYRDEAESYFIAVRKLIEWRKSLREIAGVQK